MAIFKFNLSKTEQKSEAVLFSDVEISEPFVARIWGLVDSLEPKELILYYFIPNFRAS
jgi:hypothetical protein